MRWCGDHDGSSTLRPASTISRATSATRRMFSTRSPSVKPRSLLSPCRILSTFSADSIITLCVILYDSWIRNDRFEGFQKRMVLALLPGRRTSRPVRFGMLSSARKRDRSMLTLAAESSNNGLPVLGKASPGATAASFSFAKGRSRSSCTAFPRANSATSAMMKWSSSGKWPNTSWLWRMRNWVN
jgi:hypothetical protein